MLKTSDKSIFETREGGSAARFLLDQYHEVRSIEAVVKIVSYCSYGLV